MQNHLLLVDSIDDINLRISDFVRNRFSSYSQINVLEAGCGQKWDLNLGNLQYKLTGVDISKEALEIRKFNVGDIDEIICGDIRTVNLSADEYDVIYSSFVFEHIANVEEVMENFLKWIKPGGLIILQFPDNRSVYGLLTRITPHWIHVYYKKYIQGRRNAGMPGHGPFPTVYNRILSLKEFRNYCCNNSMLIEKELGWGGYLKNIKKFRPFVSLMVNILHVATFGRYAVSHNNLAYILVADK